MYAYRVTYIRWSAAQAMNTPQRAHRSRRRRGVRRGCARVRCRTPRRLGMGVGGGEGVLRRRGEARFRGRLAGLGSRGSTSAIRAAGVSGSAPPSDISLRAGSTGVAAHRRYSVSRSDVPSSTARRVARPRGSCDYSVRSRPIGTRCTAGGEEAGDMPKNLFSRSPNGSDGPDGEANAIDTPAPGACEGMPSTGTRCRRLRRPGVGPSPQLSRRAGSLGAAPPGGSLPRR